NDLTVMDPASASELRDYLTHSNSRMDCQEKQITATNHAVQALVSQLQRLQSESVQQPTASNPPAFSVPDQAGRFSEPCLPPPAFYSGEPQQCRSSLAKCSLYISLQPSSFPTEESKVAFVITLLSGRAALWRTTVWEQKLPCCTSLQLFSEEIKKVFDRAASGREAARFLAELRQGNWSVTDYSIEFRTLAAECRWNLEAQWDMFLHGLADYIKDEIYSLELPTSLDALVDLAIRRARRAPAANQLIHLPVSSDVDVSFSEPEPMQMGRSVGGATRVSSHRSTVSRKSQNPSVGKRLLTGGVTLVALSQPIAVHALNGLSLPSITHTTGPVRLITSGNHTETIHFLLTDSPVTPVVLGHPWLVLHSPHINWSQNSILSWSESCHASCLVSACSSVSCSVFQDEHMDLSNVPSEYLNLKRVFSKSRAASLPPHRPYDCAIDLLSGTSPPKGKLYSLSAPEREAMEKYISDSLAAKIIRPSSSPAGAGFFFVKKKDRSLHPCIDYRGLNNITVKNRYPLPLMSSAFERLQGVSFFTKLDLRNAYHLVRIREGDEWKTAFNTPRGHFEYCVLPFGLSNTPAVFQALVNDVLRDMLDQFIYVYLDDILIFSHSLQEHVQHVRRVLQRLLENGLYVKAEKCVFHAQSVPFLGYIVSVEGLRMDPDKIQAVVDWPTPDSRKALQRFLGFANFYRCFIRNFSQLAAPLTALTSTKTPF
ncbi:hypothetical protein M9458_029507, partial [Cirrhinus mrigala]